jgi:hypothetical protein
MSATDVQQVQDYIRHADSAIEAASRSVEELCHRRFWNSIQTTQFEWPNFQRAYPWRIWFDAAELADVTTLVPVVTSGGVSIPNSAIFWAGSSNYYPPYRYMELDRSQSYSFGSGDTPQRNVLITGNTGYWTQTKPGGTITSGLTSSVTTVPVSDSSVVGVGDVLIIDSESMLIRDMTWSTTGLTLSSGGTTAQSNDNVLTLGGSGVNAGEVLLIDAEWMLAVAVSGSSVTVERAWNGSVLTTHSGGATVYAQRSCTVSRAFGGTTAASHNSSETAYTQLVPDLVHELALAEALVYIEQKSRSYGTQEGGPGMAKTPGAGLPGVRDQCYAAYGRKVRQRAV